MLSRSRSSRRPSFPAAMSTLEVIRDTPRTASGIRLLLRSPDLKVVVLCSSTTPGESLLDPRVCHQESCGLGMFEVCTPCMVNGLVNPDPPNAAVSQDGIRHWVHGQRR